MKKEPDLSSQSDRLPKQSEAKIVETEMKDPVLLQLREDLLAEMPELLRAGLDKKPLKDIFFTYKKIAESPASFEDFQERSMEFLPPDIKENFLVTPKDELLNDDRIKVAYKEYLLGKFSKIRKIRSKGRLNRSDIEGLEEELQEDIEDGNGHLEIGIHLAPRNIGKTPPGHVPALFGNSVEDYGGRSYVGVMYSSDLDHVWADEGNFLYILQGKTSFEMVDSANKFRLIRTPLYSKVLKSAVPNRDKIAQGVNREMILGIYPIDQQRKIFSALGVKTVSTRDRKI